ncbi:MAG: hypothetical protein ACOVMP_00895, partial [Chthoniobacterales bacterium]
SHSSATQGAALPFLAQASSLLNPGVVMHFPLRACVLRLSGCDFSMSVCFYRLGERFGVWRRFLWFERRGQSGASSFMLTSSRIDTQKQASENIRIAARKYDEGD